MEACQTNQHHTALKNKTPIAIIFCLIGVVYLGMALWMSNQDEAEIIQKTGMLLGGLSPVMMIVVTTLIGCITGLLSGWLGSVIGSIVSKK